MKDEVGAMANVSILAASLKADIRQSLTYTLPNEPYAILNAFVSLRDPEVSLDQLVERLGQSVFVTDVQAFEGREGVVIDTISFPVNWQGRRVVILSQQAMARMLEDIRSVLGSGGDVILYELGTEYGKGIAEYFMGVLGKDDLKRIYEYGLNVLAATGWGIPELVGSKNEFPNMTIKLSSCFECDGRYSKYEVCSFMRGFLAGVFGTISEHNVHGEESKCLAKGDSYCQFQLRTGRISLTR